MAELPNLAFSVSHTTRPPRKGEVNGTDYYFVTREEFEAAIEQGQFIEWAEVHSNLYGTSHQTIEDQLIKGIDVVLDIDTQGAEIIRRQKENKGVDVFIAPPSLAELESRLRGRGTDSEESIATRLNNALSEIGQAEQYQYLIVNDDFERAVEMLKAVILAERARGYRDGDGKPIGLNLDA